jgi:hypothetical protein
LGKETFKAKAELLVVRKGSKKIQEGVDRLKQGISYGEGDFRKWLLICRFDEGPVACSEDVWSQCSKIQLG